MRGWGGWGVILCTHSWCIAASRKLRKLAAEGCTLLTDTGLAAVCEACDLEDLDLTECEVRDSGEEVMDGYRYVSEYKVATTWLGKTSEDFGCMRGVNLIRVTEQRIRFTPDRVPG